jgi:tetratricopeptide (TPR) repeat protein
VFGLVDDVEFSMLREMYGEACDNSDQLVRNWKIANQFQSLWNAEQRSELGKPEVLALDAAKPQPPENRLAADPDVPFDSAVAFKPEPPVQPLPGETVAAADPAINSLDQVIAANPDDAAALSRRGQLFVLRGNVPFAIRDFNEVLRIRPKDAEAFNDRCWARAIVGDLQTALRDCNEALSIRPSYADALDSRGFVDLKIGHPNDAIADYDAALRINPRQASSLFGRGIAKIRGGDVASGTRDISAAKALQANIADEFATLGIR